MKIKFNLGNICRRYLPSMWACLSSEKLLVSEMKVHNLLPNWIKQNHFCSKFGIQCRRKRFSPTDWWVHNYVLFISKSYHFPLSDVSLSRRSREFCVKDYGGKQRPWRLWSFSHLKLCHVGFVVCARRWKAVEFD